MNTNQIKDESMVDKLRERLRSIKLDDGPISGKVISLAEMEEVARIIRDTADEGDQIISELRSTLDLVTLQYEATKSKLEYLENAYDLKCIQLFLACITNPTELLNKMNKFILDAFTIGDDNDFVDVKRVIKIFLSENKDISSDDIHDIEDSYESFITLFINMARVRFKNDNISKVLRGIAGNKRCITGIREKDVEPTIKEDKNE